MSVTNINKFKIIKALKDKGIPVNEDQVKFPEIPDELKKVGVDTIMLDEGNELTEEEIQTIIKITKDLKKD